MKLTYKQKQICVLAEDVGVEISTTHVGHRNYQYDGRTIAWNKISSMIHDIAHYQLAAPGRRTMSSAWGVDLTPVVRCRHP